jgi:hypothetical protein
MSRCPVNDENGKHNFSFILQQKGPDYIYQFLTCIGCGERRALATDGRLMFWNDKSQLWVSGLQPSDGEVK